MHRLSLYPQAASADGPLRGRPALTLAPTDSGERDSLGGVSQLPLSSEALGSSDVMRLRLQPESAVGARVEAEGA
jgi:hypothetical protein